MCCGKCEYGNRDGCTTHVNGKLPRGIEIEYVSSSSPNSSAELHVNRNVGCGTTCKECSNTAVLETFQNQWIWILAVADEYDDWVNNQCYEEYASYDYEDQSSVAKQNAESLLGDRIEDQAHNSERRTTDDPSNGL